MNHLLHDLTNRYGSPVACTSARLGDTTGTARRFKIDDETDTDCYPAFCRLFITVVPEHDQLLLELQDSPCAEDVTAVVQEAGGEVRRSHSGATITVVLPTGNAHFVKKLAKAIRHTTARGRRYPDPNWKWISPRTADALNQFATVLAASHRSARQTARVLGTRL